MTQEEYKRETNQAIELIKAMDNVFGTKYYPGCAQSGSDTDTLVNALTIFKIHIDYVIEHIEHIGEKYKKDKEYNEFEKWREEMLKELEKDPNYMNSQDEFGYIARLQKFYHDNCELCGSQRCTGVYDKEWREGCKLYKKEFCE